MKLHLGDVAVMPCRVTGLVQPRITWFRNDEKLDAADIRYIFHVDGSLEISSLKSTDFGNYRCQAEGGDKRFIQSTSGHLAIEEDRSIETLFYFLYLAIVWIWHFKGD